MVGVISRPFFNFVLHRVFSISILTTSLLLYSKRNRRLIWLGVIFGFVMQMLIASFSGAQVFRQFLMNRQAFLHILLSTLLTLSTTVLGLEMTRQRQPKRASFKTRLTFFLVPLCYILDQGLDINLYRNARELPGMNAFTTLVSSGIVCFLFSLIYSASVRYAPTWIQTCIFSTVVYFTGAIELSKLAGYIELNYRTNPAMMKSLVYTIRQSKQMSAGVARRFLNAMMGKQPQEQQETTDWMSTGYSVYWFFISFSLMYKYWRNSSKNKV